jgi:glycerol-3-phosphate dehydrogenase (NAD(P)+)
VEFWDANPKLVPDQKPLEQILPGADYVLFCVPSWAMRPAVLDAVPHMKSDAIVISFAKGIEESSLQTMAEMIPDILRDGQHLVVVGGPMLAEEIAAGKKAVGVFACKDAAVLKKTCDLFKGEDFSVETSDDPVSVSFASVLKNIYAVALGIADGLELSGNEKGWITACAINEMVNICDALKIDPKIVLGTAGVGDLIATGYSSYSRNRQVGAEIVKSGVCNLRGEGLVSLPFLLSRIDGKISGFPLMKLVDVVGLQCNPARPAFELFFENSVY